MVNKIDLSLKTRKTTLCSKNCDTLSKFAFKNFGRFSRAMGVDFFFFSFDPNKANFCNCVVHNDKGPKTIILVHLSLMIAHALLNLTKRIAYIELVRRLHYKLLLYLHQKILDLDKILIVLRGLLYFTGMKLKIKLTSNRCCQC